MAATALALSTAIGCQENKPMKAQMGLVEIPRILAVQAGQKIPADALSISQENKHCELTRELDTKSNPNLRKLLLQHLNTGKLNILYAESEYWSANSDKPVTMEELFRAEIRTGKFEIQALEAENPYGMKMVGKASTFFFHGYDDQLGLWVDMTILGKETEKFDAAIYAKALSDKPISEVCEVARLVHAGLIFARFSDVFRPGKVDAALDILTDTEARLRVVSSFPSQQPKKVEIYGHRNATIELGGPVYVSDVEILGTQK